MIRRGFTLIEVIIALAIAATAFVAIAGTLRAGAIARCRAAYDEGNSSKLADKLLEIMSGQETHDSGTLENGKAWALARSAPDIPGASNLVVHVIRLEGDERTTFKVIRRTPDDKGGKGPADE